MTVEKYIQERLSIPSTSIENTLQLLAEDCTIPFIARYRKDKTGNLDEVAIEQIFKLNKSFDEIAKLTQIYNPQQKLYCSLKISWYFLDLISFE